MKNHTRRIRSKRGCVKGILGFALLAAATYATEFSIDFDYDPPNSLPGEGMYGHATGMRWDIPMFTTVGGTTYYAWNTITGTGNATGIQDFTSILDLQYSFGEMGLTDYWSAGGYYYEVYRPETGSVFNAGFTYVTPPSGPPVTLHGSDFQFTVKTDISQNIGNAVGYGYVTFDAGQTSPFLTELAGITGGRTLSLEVWNFNSLAYDYVPPYAWDYVADGKLFVVPETWVTAAALAAGLASLLGVSRLRKWR